MANIAPPEIERECDVVSRRLMIHLARGEYAIAADILAVASQRIDAIRQTLGKPPETIGQLELPMESYSALFARDVKLVWQLERFTREDLIAAGVLSKGQCTTRERKLRRWGIRLRGIDSAVA